MGMTIAEKIIAAAAGVESVKPGDIHTVELDRLMSNDGTTHLTVDMYNNKLKNPHIADTGKLVFIVDHNVPSDCPKTAASQKKMRDFAKANHIDFWEGKGVCHQIMMENYVRPGELIFGADSHTCSYGALGAFGTGVGCTDFLYGMVTGTSWVMVPETVKFNLVGKLPEGVYARDLILTIIGEVGANGCNYQVMEFTGEGAKTLTISDRIALCNMAVEAGAKFIVSPGLNPDTVEYCVKKGIPILPGCSSPSDIEQAIKYGLDVVKFFPAEAAGGLKAIKAMAAPYSQIRFMPTGGINPSNVSDYLAEDKILACGGTWMVPAAEIEAGNFDKIRELTEEAVRSMLGFRLAHVGINCDNESEAHHVAGAFDTMFGFAPNENPSSIFSAGYVETMKTPYLGSKGHIAIATYSVELAKAYLERKGVKFNENSIVYRPDGKIQAIYMAEEVGGFAIHLVRKPKEA